MQPEEFTSFADEKPAKHKHLIVTNRINGKNAHGEMSHVWMTTFWIKSEKEGEGIVSFDAADRKIFGLTHWKYA